MKKHKKARARAFSKKTPSMKRHAANAHAHSGTKKTKTHSHHRIPAKKKPKRSFLSAFLPRTRVPAKPAHSLPKKKPLSLHFPSFLSHSKKVNRPARPAHPPLKKPEVFSGLPKRLAPKSPPSETTPNKTVKTVPPPSPAPRVTRGFDTKAIVTVYDQVLELVHQKNGIALNELAKRVKLTEAKLVEELQTLEDNGLVEVRYPPFGEPKVYLKEKSEA